MSHEYRPQWQQGLETSLTKLDERERRAGLSSVWDATPETIASMRPDQRGHLRVAAKILRRMPWRDSQIRGDEVLAWIAAEERGAL